VHIGAESGNRRVEGLAMDTPNNLMDPTPVFWSIDRNKGLAHQSVMNIRKESDTY
jgi:hypothetical protein